MGTRRMATALARACKAPAVIRMTLPRQRRTSAYLRGSFWISLKRTPLYSKWWTFPFKRSGLSNPMCV